MKKQLGVSLSEVLVSLFLASFIMTLLTQFYLSSKHQYLETEAILEANFDVQWVGDLLSDSIRRAGFTPCMGLEQLQLLENGHAVQRIKIEPQQIQVHRMNEEFVQIVKVSNSTQIQVSRAIAFHKNRPLLIADCEHAEVQHIASMEGTLITLDKPLRFTYAKPAYIGEFLQERWFIKQNPSGESTLHYQLAQTEEITPLVHSLVVRSRRVDERQFLEVLMGLAAGKTQKLMIAVRGS